MLPDGLYETPHTWTGGTKGQVNKDRLTRTSQQRKVNKDKLTKRQVKDKLTRTVEDKDKLARNV